jgi:AcrR family transcriptional regulator
MTQSSYHHGDLRNAILSAALDLVEKRGTYGFSLREAAVAVGVTAGAVYRHFKSKDELLGEIAFNGFVILSDRTQSARKKVLLECENTKKLVGPELLRAIGLEYVYFAMEHPTQFRLMFGSRSATYRDIMSQRLAEESVLSSLDLLIEAINKGSTIPSDAEVQARAIYAWSIVHGLATLIDDGYIQGTKQKIRKIIDSSVMGAVAFIFPEEVKINSLD